MNFFEHINIKVGQGFTIKKKTSREVLPIEEGLYELVYINSGYISGVEWNYRYVFVLKEFTAITVEMWKKNEKSCDYDQTDNGNFCIHYTRTFKVKEFNEKEIKDLFSLYKEGYIEIIEKYK